VLAYAPGLWRHFGLTVTTVWEIGTAEFHHCVTYIDRYEEKEAAANGRE
jgi:hypothetical protein